MIRSSYVGAETQQHDTQQPSPSDAPKATPSLSQTASERRKYWLKRIDNKTVLFTDERGHSYATKSFGGGTIFTLVEIGRPVHVFALREQQNGETVAAMRMRVDGIAVGEFEAQASASGLWTSGVASVPRGLKAARIALYQAKDELKDAEGVASARDLSWEEQRAAAEDLRNAKEVYLRRKLLVEEIEDEAKPLLRALKAERESLRRTYVELRSNGFGDLADYLHTRIRAQGSTFVFIEAKWDRYLVTIG